MADLANACWKKSTRSNNAGNCVEVALTSSVVGTRDTKNRDGGHLAVRPASWATFIDAVKNGAYDLDR